MRHQITKRSYLPAIRIRIGETRSFANSHLRIVKRREIYHEQRS
jgi:hypothetical protein